MSFFAWPPASAFGRVVPKNKIYEHAGANTALKDLFVKEVETITWAHKLAPETINLPATNDVPEIQVFEIVLRGDSLAKDVLQALDAAIPFPLIYELSFQGRRKMVAGFKRPSEDGRGGTVTSTHFKGAWVAEPVPRQLLPVALDLRGLYAGILAPLMPVANQTGADIRATVEQVEEIRKLEREIERLNKAMQREKQFNRKLGLNAELRKLQALLAGLKGTGNDG